MCPRLRFPGAELKLSPDIAVSGVPWRDSGSMNGFGLSRRGRGGARGPAFWEVLWVWGVPLGRTVVVAAAAELCLLCADIMDDCAGETVRVRGGGD